LLLIRAVQHGEMRNNVLPKYNLGRGNNISPVGCNLLVKTSFAKQFEHADNIQRYRSPQKAGISA